LRSAQGQINDGTYVANRLWVIDILRDLGPLPFYPPREGFCQLKQRRILVQTPMMTCPRRKPRRVELEGCAPYEYNDGSEKAQNHVGDHYEREKWAIRTPRAGWGSASAKFDIRCVRCKGTEATTLLTVPVPSRDSVLSTAFPFANASFPPIHVQQSVSIWTSNFTKGSVEIIVYSRLFLPRSSSGLSSTVSSFFHVSHWQSQLSPSDTVNLLKTPSNYLHSQMGHPITGVLDSCGLAPPI